MSLLAPLAVGSASTCLTIEWSSIFSMLYDLLGYLLYDHEDFITFRNIMDSWNAVLLFALKNRIWICATRVSRSLQLLQPWAVRKHQNTTCRMGQLCVLCYKCDSVQCFFPVRLYWTLFTNINLVFTLYKQQASTESLTKIRWLLCSRRHLLWQLQHIKANRYGRNQWVNLIRLIQMMPDGFFCLHLIWLYLIWRDFIPFDWAWHDLRWFGLILIDLALRFILLCILSYSLENSTVRRTIKSAIGWWTKVSSMIPLILAPLRWFTNSPTLLNAVDRSSVIILWSYWDELSGLCRFW